MSIPSGHNHPIEGQVVIIHSPGVITHDNLTESPMHAFGPFASEADALIWSNNGEANDECVKLIIDIFEPVGYVPSPGYETGPG